MWSPVIVSLKEIINRWLFNNISILVGILFDLIFGFSQFSEYIRQRQATFLLNIYCFEGLLYQN